jgi:hypothetical protein
MRMACCSGESFWGPPAEDEGCWKLLIMWLLEEIIGPSYGPIMALAEAMSCY